MEQIKNIDVYNKRMRKAMSDKLFFTDMVKDVDAIVDFGCADGTLLSLLSEKYSDKQLYGIDISEDMINIANERVPSAKFIVNNVPVLVGENIDYNRCALVLSSVLHEVKSYSSDEEEERFWDAVSNSGYKYVIIRDMIDSFGTEVIEESEDMADKVRDIVYKGTGAKSRLLQFEDIWGKIESKRNLYHYLLKYKYVENWEREVHENYIGIEKNN